MTQRVISSEPRMSDAAPVSDPTTLGSLLRTRTNEDPDAVFMVWQDEEYRRSWLMEQSLAYARSLTERGFQKGERVALLLTNGPEFVIAFFGNALDFDSAMSPSFDLEGARAVAKNAISGGRT